MSARIAALIGLLFLVGSASAHEYSSNGVTVVHPWARATSTGAKVGVAFFEMKAAPGHADRLIAARSATWVRPSYKSESSRMALRRHITLTPSRFVPARPWR
jgi:copper(I)-binding protein